MPRKKDEKTIIPPPSVDEGANPVQTPIVPVLNSAPVDVQQTTEVVQSQVTVTEQPKIEATKSEVPNEIKNLVVRPPHRTFKRDERGLMEGIDYRFRPDGRIDWQAMLNPESFIYIKNSKNPLIKVGGLQDLAEIRGVESKKIEFVQTGPDMVLCKVTFKYIPNFEDPNGREWSAMADGSSNNLGKDFVKFLTAMAETRAIGRCHREVLGIRLCTYEEMSIEDQSKVQDSPINDVTIAAIGNQLPNKGYTMEQVMEKVRKEHPEAKSLSDLTQGQGAIVLKWLNDKPNIKNQG